MCVPIQTSLLGWITILQQAPEAILLRHCQVIAQNGIPRFWGPGGSWCGVTIMMAISGHERRFQKQKQSRLPAYHRDPGDPPVPLDLSAGRLVAFWSSWSGGRLGSATSHYMDIDKFSPPDHGADHHPLAAHWKKPPLVAPAHCRIALNEPVRMNLLGWDLPVCSAWRSVRP